MFIICYNYQFNINYSFWYTKMEIVYCVSHYYQNMMAEKILLMADPQQKKSSQNYTEIDISKYLNIQFILLRLFGLQSNFNTNIQIIDKNLTSKYLSNRINHANNRQIIQELMRLDHFRFKIKVQEYFFTQLKFHIFNYMIIDRQIGTLCIQAILVKDGVPFQIYCKNMKLLLMRFLNQLNAKLYGANIRIDYNTGALYLRVQSILTQKYFKQIIQQQNAFENYINGLMNNALNYMKQNLVDILYLIQQISGKLLNKYNSIFIISFRDDFQGIIDKIWKCIYLSKYQYQIFFNKKKSNEEQKNVNKILKNLNIFLDQFDNRVKKLKDLKQNRKWMEQNQHSFNKYLKIPTVKPTKQDDNISVISKIIILNTQQIKYQNITTNTSSILKKADINFIYRDTNVAEQQKEIIRNQNLNKLTKIVVFKQDLNSRNRVPHQKKILTTQKIRRKGFAYLIKCYHTIQPQFLRFLIMDYCIHHSLRHYQTNHKITLSLLTKIYILCQIIQGLRQCKQCDIVHLDIKPENILITKNLAVKLTDFGESYHRQVEECKSNYQPGYTIPYCSPQIFKPKIDFSEKLDVFSFGMLMHEFLFQFLPVQLRNQSHQKLIQKYKNQNFSSMIELRANVQMTQKIGPISLFQALMYLISKCISNKDTQRPYLEWMIIIIRESLNYLDRLY